MNSIIGQFKKVPLLKLWFSELSLWIPIILLDDIFNIGEPDEPFFVLQKWLKLYFLSSYIAFNILYDTDNFPSGYCIMYIVSPINTWFEFYWYYYLRYFLLLYHLILIIHEYHLCLLLILIL